MAGADRPAGRRRTPTPAQQEAAARAREERLAALHTQLADGVAAITDGAAWRAWLDVAGRFHQYSFGNQLLIAVQRPGATRVAGYRAWQAMGRQVRKGETAIMVLAPVRRRPTTETTDRRADQPIPDRDAPAHEPGAQGQRIVGWTSAAVFDIAQTDGDPLPSPPKVQLLAGQTPPGLWDALERAITGLGWTVTRCPDAAAIDGAVGLTNLRTHTVTVRADVPDAEAAATLAHEAGHVLLHASEPPAPGESAPTCRGLVEVEAESVAYLIAAHHGLDTSGSSFAYIAGWAGRDQHAVQTTAQRVLRAARTLLELTDPTAHPVAGEQAAHRATGAAATTQQLAEDASATLARARAGGEPAPGPTSPAATEVEAARQLLADAQNWFIARAEHDPAYRQAVTARRHDPEQARADGIGWAPASWTGLVDHLRDLGHTPEQILDSGVAILSRARLLDRFRARITFPIHDQHGVVGWTARDTTGRPGTPKYLNTPTTGQYDKSRLLYGSPDLPGAHTVVLVEGPWDAYAVTRAGQPGVIGLATCGTAVTAAQLHLAAARGARLTVGADRDQAGLNALGRTLDLTRNLGIAHPEVVLAGSGKDLADRYAAGGPGALRTDLGQPQPAGLAYAQLQLDMQPSVFDTPESRVRLARAAASQADGLTLPQRGRLAHLLITRIGLTPDAAIDICRPAASPERSGQVRPAAVPPALRHPTAAACR